MTKDSEKTMPVRASIPEAMAPQNARADEGLRPRVKLGRRLASSLGSVRPSASVPTT
jgi:hypothetical protein